MFADDSQNLPRGFVHGGEAGHVGENLGDQILGLSASHRGVALRDDRAQQQPRGGDDGQEYLQQQEAFVNLSHGIRSELVNRSPDRDTGSHDVRK